MELPNCNHPGKLPEEQVEAGIGDLLECGQETAIARIAKNAKMARKEIKEHAEIASTPMPLAVTPQQKAELESARSDIFKYFGLVTHTREVAVPVPGSV